MNQKNNSVTSAETKDDSSTIADVTTSSPNNAKPMLAAGCWLTFKHEIFSEGGRIIAEKGKKVKVLEILKNPSYIGKRTGQFYEEKVYGVKLDGYRGEWLLSSFVETYAACS